MYSEMVRRCRRILLEHAINGTPADRLKYATTRAATRSVVQLAAYGQCLQNVEAESRLAAHWYRRLNKLAERRA